MMEALNNSNRTFSSLGVSSDFIHKAEKLGLYTLEDALQVKVERLRAHKEFTMVWYAELLNLLKEQGLIRKFQENQL